MGDAVNNPFTDVEAVVVDAREFADLVDCKTSADKTVRIVQPALGRIKNKTLSPEAPTISSLSFRPKAAETGSVGKSLSMGVSWFGPMVR